MEGQWGWLSRPAAPLNRCVSAAGLVVIVFRVPASADLVYDGPAVDRRGLAGELVDGVVAGVRPARLGDVVGVTRFVKEPEQLGAGQFPAGVDAHSGGGCPIVKRNIGVLPVWSGRAVGQGRDGFGAKSAAVPLAGDHHRGLQISEAHHVVAGIAIGCEVDGV